MSNFFNPDNKVFVAIGRIGDYMLLSVLWLICSIPIFTVGASTTAMYYSSLKLLANEETYLYKDFFHSFKQNFKQSTLLWLLFLVVGIFCAADLYFYFHMTSTVGIIVFAIFLSVTLMYLITLLYLFPYVSRFYCTFRQAIKSSFLLSIRHLGYTILMIVTDILVVLVAGYFTFLLLFLPGIICFANSLCFRHIFKRYLPEEEKSTDDFASIEEIELRDAAEAARKKMEQNSLENKDDLSDASEEPRE